jgi:hypothetical protein
MSESTKEKINDPALYRRLQEPFGTVQEAEAATVEFFEGVRKLREQHRIPDTYCTAMFSYLGEDGEETIGIMSHLNGDANRAIQMLAHALGREQRRMDELIGRIRTGRGG